MSSFVYKLCSALAIIALMASLNVCSASLLSVEVDRTPSLAVWLDCDIQPTSSGAPADDTPAKPKRQIDSPSGPLNSMSGGWTGSFSGPTSPVGIAGDAAWAPGSFSTRFVQIYKRHLPPLVVALDFKIPIA